MPPNNRLHPCDVCEKQKPDNELRVMRGIYNHGYACSECRNLYCVQCVLCDYIFIEQDPEVDFRVFPAIRNILPATQWACNRCYQNLTRPRRLEHRGYHSKLIGKGKGDIVDSARGWSTEIECYLTNQSEVAKSFDSLPNTFGINRDGSLTHAGHGTRDGKVLEVGIEITTPILVGKQGEEYLLNLCGALNKADNARVDLTCGTHLHIDMSDFRKDFATVQRILAFHWIYETVIMSFLPSTRRANVYCQSLKNSYSIKRIMHCTTYDELYKVWYKNRHVESRYNKKHTRYHGINMHSLFADGHIEIRYHSGTTNPKKIIYWAALHTRIIDLCAGLTEKKIDVATIVSEGLTPLGRPRALSTLTKQFFDLLQLKEETMDYLVKRQKKFKDMAASTEVEFIEKDDPAIYEGGGKEFTAAADPVETVRHDEIRGGWTAPIRATTRSIEEIIEAANQARDMANLEMLTHALQPTPPFEPISIDEAELSDDELIDQL